ncbi:MAG: DUF3015 domain-containing protein [Nitrospirota bacterium]|nr:DUF3015 domain-containing protein [Nitrospirota bacterium]MDH5774825.1 DUF3015 domain-containing protein [Nitrospirota bacterium]
MTIVQLIVWGLVGTVLSGCTLKATTDTSTDGTTEFLSSTTGGTWWTEDGLIKPGHHAGAFVALNYDNLLQDMAKGEGEYVAAFGKLLHVHPVHQQAFADRLQQRYPDLSGLKVGQDPMTVKQFLHEVDSVTTQTVSPSL